MKRPFLRMIAIYLAALAISGAAIVYAASDGVQVQLIVNPQVCNNNNICEPGLGETTSNCASDCHAPPGENHPGSGGIYVRLVDPLTIRIEAGTTTAAISWASIRPTVSIFYWGRTNELEQGSLSETQFSADHAVKLDHLTPDTQYFFRIFSRDQPGDASYTSVYSFRTLPLYGAYTPENISNFAYSITQRGILLTWKNPTELDFDHVRIMRSEFYYPRDPFDGTLVFEASGEGFEDINVVPGVIYYYTAFAVTKDGLFSSGVSLSGMFPTNQAVRPPIDFNPPTPTKGNNVPELPTGTATSTAGSYLDDLDLSKFIFTQKGIPLTITNGEMDVDGDTSVTVSYANIPEPYLLKNIEIHVQDPYNGKNFFSYLLRYDKDSQVYRAVLNPFKKEGKYNFTIRVYDYASRTAKDIVGAFNVSELQTTAQNVENGAPKSPCDWFWLLLMIILTLILLHYLFIKKKDTTSPQL